MAFSFIALQLAAQALPTLHQNRRQMGVGDNWEQCIQDACAHHDVRQRLVDWCLRKRAGDPQCEGLQLVDGYSRHKNGMLAYSMTSDLKYGASDIVFKQQDELSLCAENNLAKDATSVIDESVKTSATLGWTLTENANVNFDFTVNLQAKPPVGMQAALQDSFSARIDVGSTQKTTERIDQTMGLQQTWTIPKKGCVNGTITTRRGALTAPFVATTTIRGNYDHARQDDSGVYTAQCCFRRPGGAENCGLMGPDKDNHGWSNFLTAAEVVQYSSCPGYYRSGNDAKFDIWGQFEGDYGVEAITSTKPCSRRCEPANDKMVGVF